MKLFHLLLASLLLPLSLHAQKPCQELGDPHPADAASWRRVSAPCLGWGSIDQRYPKTAVPQLNPTIRLSAWKGERVNAQALLVTPKPLSRVYVEASSLRSGKGVISSAQVKIYYARYVMADGWLDIHGHSNHHRADKSQFDSSLVADPLLPAQPMDVEGQTVRPIWLDIKIPASAPAGKYQGTLRVNADGRVLTVPYTVSVSKRTLPEPAQWKFHLDLWQNPYAVARYYGVPLWSEVHFRLMRPLMEQYAAAGGKVITTSIIQHPWNSQTEDPFESMIGKTLTLDGHWQYDYSVFDKWVSFMMSCGVKGQIDCYTILPWHLRFDYYDARANCTLSRHLKPGTADYEAFLLPFLKDFAAHLKQKGWFDRTCIAMDERPMDILTPAHQLLRKADPDFKIEGAFNYFPKDVSDLHDISVAYEYDLLDGASVRQRTSQGRPVTFYTCCGPQRPNTFLFSPPAESAYMGWHAAASGYSGYLRWAYNSWSQDPLRDARFRTWPAGDCFLVYPGGSSIRWMRLVQGIQDYEKIAILRDQLKGRKLQKLNQIVSKFRTNKFTVDNDAGRMVREAEQVMRSLE